MAIIQMVTCWLAEHQANNKYSNPNNAFHLIVVLGYNGITGGSTYWTTICHWPNGRYFDVTSLCSCGCSFVVVLKKAVNARYGHWQVFFGFLVVDMIPYVITGTCSMEHKRGIDFLLLVSFPPPTILFTFQKTITPYMEMRSQQSWNRCGIISML
jgi:hypothetical protein